MEFSRDALLRDLQENVVEVFFTKVNGEQRRMRCTLRKDYLPPNTDLDYLKEEHRKETNLNIIVAWDVEKGGWRSFRIDSVMYAEAKDGY